MSKETFRPPTSAKSVNKFATEDKCHENVKHFSLLQSRKLKEKNLAHLQID